MRLDLDRGRVIGEHGQNPIKLFKDHPDNSVYPLDRANLFLDISQMPGFIRGFDMEIEKVKVFDRLERIPSFCCIIGIKIAGSARYL